jgi:hypothetical protein
MGVWEMGVGGCGLDGEWKHEDGCEGGGEGEHVGGHEGIGKGNIGMGVGG